MSEENNEEEVNTQIDTNIDNKQSSTNNLGIIIMRIHKLVKVTLSLGFA